MIDKEEVRRLRELGLSYRHIGQAVGASHERVRQILETPERTNKRVAAYIQKRGQARLLDALAKRKAMGMAPTETMIGRIHSAVEADPAFAERIDEVLKEGEEGAQ